MCTSREEGNFSHHRRSGGWTVDEHSPFSKLPGNTPFCLLFGGGRHFLFIPKLFALLNSLANSLFVVRICGQWLRCVAGQGIPAIFLSQQNMLITFKEQVLTLKIIGKSKSVTYRFYFFVQNLPKFFNILESMTKSYLVEFKVHRKMAYYSLQKIVLNKFPRNFFI